MTTLNTTTLVDLLARDHSHDEVLITFNDYARSGAGISYNSVKAILDKFSLTIQELDVAYEHMQLGMIRQIKFGNGIEALTYLQSMNYIAKGIASMNVPFLIDLTTDPLVSLKTQLLRAHDCKSKADLKKAVDIFKQYAIQSNPSEFAEGAAVVNLTGPGLKGIYTKSYDLSKYGGSISVYNYLMGIHATDDLQIEEAPARKQ
jgi:hypothetical protein